MRSRPRRLTIGLTGNIATGKSTVHGMLEERGAVGIDADDVYHQLIRPHEPLWRTLVAEFGVEILGPADEIDRRKLGAIVFADPEALARLDRLTHPAVVDAIREIQRCVTAPVLVIDAVKLSESGLGAECDQIWLVTAPVEAQIARLMSRNGLSRIAAEQRIAAQPDRTELAKQATVVITNDGSLADLANQVGRAWSTWVEPALSEINTVSAGSHE